MSKTKRNALREHEEKIFRASTEFVAHLFQPLGQSLRESFDNFPAAVERTKTMHDEYGRKGMVYGVTPAGRSVALSPGEWPHYLAIWNKLHPTTKG